MALYGLWVETSLDRMKQESPPDANYLLKSQPDQISTYPVGTTLSHKSTRNSYQKFTYQAFFNIFAETQLPKSLNLCPSGKNSRPILAQKRRDHFQIGLWQPCGLAVFKISLFWFGSLSLCQLTIPFLTDLPQLNKKKLSMIYKSRFPCYIILTLLHLPDPKDLKTFPSIRRTTGHSRTSTVLLTSDFNATSSLELNN